MYDDINERNEKQIISLINHKMSDIIVDFRKIVLNLFYMGSVVSAEQTFSH